MPGWRWGQHYSWLASSFLYLDIISPSLACTLESLKLSMRVVDIEHSCYGYAEEAALLSDCDVLGAYKWVPADTAAVTQDVISLLVCWPPSPKICHPPWGNWWKKTCAHTSAASVQIQLPSVSLAQEFKLRCWTLKSWGMCMCCLLLGVDFGREKQKRE